MEQIGGMLGPFTASHPRGAGACKLLMAASWPSLSGRRSPDENGVREDEAASLVIGVRIRSGRVVDPLLDMFGKRIDVSPIPQAGDEVIDSVHPPCDLVPAEAEIAQARAVGQRLVHGRVGDAEQGSLGQGLQLVM